MLKSAAAKKRRHDSIERKRPTNQREWKIMNQVNQAPEIIKNRIANMELRRAFLEGQNIRNSESEKMRLRGILERSRVPTLMAGRFRGLHPQERAAMLGRIMHLDNNPGNRPYIAQHPAFTNPIIGSQPRLYFA